ncbi:methyltransferase domain-containing protein [Phaeodactylibacter luteus]|uniref:Methyltransferase domain-containing protein n=1 Tax=Phaeodactylibacter luteus TaxID=1564516 RepID=A0A5C6S0R0_9BACT|nr:methyltransferase domain-containing protein [Phaeodactylibacter luteus]TXB67984.1 methyltransferase domain-containing protein [Phaeodactylibacter luteus]
MQLVQHKKEAYWFYRFLSIFYDKLVNPLFWTVPMRRQSLAIGKLDEPGITVIDVGSGTGFTTEGIVEHVPPQRVTCLDQSPHQMAHAKAKPALQGCTFLLGDAEHLPFPDHSFDRYVSAGSIEYWPDPAQGIREAFRVVKPGGWALMIGPLEPVHPAGRILARLWMLFPPEADYWKWFREAGFTDLEACYVKPNWAKGKGRYGIALAGRKPEGATAAAPKPQPKAENTEKPGLLRSFLLGARVILGSLAGFFFIPAALIGQLRLSISGQGHLPPEEREHLNTYQKRALLFIAGAVALAVFLLIR